MTPPTIATPTPRQRHRLQLFGGAGVNGANPPVLTEGWCSCGEFVGYGDETETADMQFDALRKAHLQHKRNYRLGGGEL